MANTGPDPAIVGNNMSTGDYILFADVAGDIPLAVRPSGGMGMLIKSLLGSETTPDQIGGCMRLKYNGSELSCKLSASGGGNSITSYVGAKGSETGDTNFGSNGVLSLTAAAQDTLGELVTVIDGYSDYQAEKIFGVDGYDISGGTNSIISVAQAQGKDNWTYLFFDSPDSGCYRHEFIVDLGTGERPTLTLQKDGYGIDANDGFVYAGCVVDSINLSGALKAIVEGSTTIYGFTEATGQAYETALTLEDLEPVIYYRGDFALGGNNYNFTRNFDVTFVNNHNTDGYGGGSLDRQYHQKGMFGANGTIQVRLDQSSFGERNKIFSNTDQAALTLEFSSKYIINTATTQVPEFMLIEMPYCALTSYEFVENTGIIDATIGFNALSPKGTIYNDPVKITLINQDPSAY
jgi:hypothetical protein